MTLCGPAFKKMRDLYAAFVRDEYCSAAVEICTTAENEADTVRKQSEQNRRAWVLAHVIKERARRSSSTSDEPDAIGAAAAQVNACIVEASQPVLSTFIDNDRKITTLLETCRPEIEAHARAQFVAQNRLSLDEVRQQAFANAKQAAIDQLGAMHTEQSQSPSTQAPPVLGANREGWGGARVLNAGSAMSTAGERHQAFAAVPEARR